MIATCELGLSIDSFWDLSPLEWSILREGYIRKQERQNVEAWQQTRFLGCMIVNSVPNHGKQKRKFIKPEDLVQLPGDKITGGGRLTTEEVIKLMQEEEAQNEQ